MGENMEGTESKLDTRMEGANRCLSATIISLTAVVVTVLEFKGYMAFLIEDVGSRTAANFLKLLLWITILTLFSSFVTCTMCLNLDPSKKRWYVRAIIAYVGLIFWDIFMLVVILLVLGSGAKKEIDEIIDASDMRNFVYFAVLFLVLLSVNVGFMYLPCWWDRKQKAKIQSEKLPEATVVDDLLVHDNHGALACTGGSDESTSQNLNSGSSEIEHGTFGTRTSTGSEMTVRSKCLDRWDTTVFNLRWKDQSNPRGHVHINRQMHRFKTPTYVKKFLKVGNWFYKYWDAVREEEGKFRYSVWVLSAALVTIMMLIVSLIGMIVFFKIQTNKMETYANKALDFQTKIDDLVQKNNQTIQQVFNETFGGALDQVKESLKVFEMVHKENPNLVGGRNMTEEIQKLSGLIDRAHSGVVLLNEFTAVVHFSGTIYNAPKYLSSFTKVLNRTIPTGLAIGTLIGLFAVYTMLASHKKMSIQFSEEIALHSRSGQEDKDSWFGIEAKYPIGNAVYFLGVMTSTAWAQQLIFGFLISLMIALIFDVRGYGYFLNLCGYKLMFVLATVAINQFIVKVFGNKFLTDGFHIKRVHFFFMYMCTFSMMHFVLGVYYAAFRIVGMIVTSLFVIARLDMTIFSYGKTFDNGHNAFMSMLVFTHVIQKNKQHTKPESSVEETRKREYDLDEALADLQESSLGKPLLSQSMEDGSFRG